MECQNPECHNEVQDPNNKHKIYCCTRCRNRVKTLKNNVAARMKSHAKKRPCRRCGNTADYGCIYCADCRKIDWRDRKEPPRPGIAPLRTPAIRKSRQREQELIDAVVAKARAAGTCYVGIPLHDKPRRTIHGVKVG